ncbi:hypothetical protein MRX96_034846 [Rhipicephalus microplus]
MGDATSAQLTVIVAVAAASEVQRWLDRESVIPLLSASAGLLLVTATLTSILVCIEAETWRRRALRFSRGVLGCCVGSSTAVFGRREAPIPLILMKTSVTLYA